MDDSVGAALQNPSALQSLLQLFLEANNESRQNAEKIIVKILKKKECVHALMQQIVGGNNIGPKQLSAILLRKKVALHWKKLAPSDQQNVQEVLLERLLQESEKLVRNAIAHLVSTIGKLTIPSGKWPKLLPFVMECTKSQNPSHREIAMILLYALTDTVEDQMKQHLSNVVEVLLGGLKDSDVSVRFASLRAVAPILGFVESQEELQTCARVIPFVLEVLQQCIVAQAQTHNETYLDLAMQVFEVFDDLSTISLPGTNQLMAPLLQTMLGIASNTSTNMVIRERATMVLAEIVSERPTAIVKQNMIEPVLMLSLSILTEQYHADLFDVCEDDEDDDLERVVSAQHFASQLLDEVSTALPNSKIFPICFQWCQGQITSGQGSPASIKAAVLALGLICRGCRDPMRSNIDSVIDMVIATMQHSESPVRQAALFTMGQVLEFLQPEIIEKSARLMPQLFQMFNDTCPKVREKCAYALESLAENVDKQLIPYLPHLMERLNEMLKNGTKKTQEIAISCISAIVEATGQSFKGYAPAILTLMKQIMTCTDEDLLVLRARATECVGVIAASVGRELFQPYFEEFFTLSMKGLELDFTELTEYTFGFFQNMAELLQMDWVPYLQVTMPPLLLAIEQDDGQYKTRPGAFGTPNIELSDSDPDEDDDEDDDDSEEGRHFLRISSSELEKKAAAVYTVGIFAKVTKHKFEPFLVQTYEKVVTLMDYFHESVRENVMFALRHFLSVPYALHPPAQPVQKGVPQVDTLQPPVREAVNMVMSYYFSKIEDEDNKEVIKTICDAISDMVKEMGSVSIHGHIEHLTEVTISLLNRKTLCQTLADDEEDEDSQEKDHDQVLIDAVFEMIDEIAKVYGPGFTTIWAKIQDHVLEYLGPKHPASDHSMALGTLAEVCNSMEDRSSLFYHKLFPIVFNFLTSEEAGARSNAVFAIGVLCKHCPDLCAPSYPQILERINLLLDTNTNPGNVVDNACGALARMIQSKIDLCHFDQVFPVLLTKLPLRQDFQENESVYGLLCFLVSHHAARVINYMERIIQLFVYVLKSSDLDNHQNVRDGCASTLQRLLNGDENLRRYAQSLPEEDLAALKKYVFFV